MGKVVAFRRKSKWKKYMPVYIMLGVLIILTVLVYLYVKQGVSNPQSVPSITIHSKW
ncbi:hypothetical protein [Ectobacillus ponti]|uniref:Uncharacterized protein n=1 Tax=Ectobacillus ponti TaxID=2961894 RepID=A0AA42BTJ4_9BACI|nr:hypothetical protein [Ectobacillus ponti]MCP8969538.1 hypothetical protein [Ectobacillus ponti]